jgi:hypothetical protein
LALIDPLAENLQNFILGLKQQAPAAKIGEIKFNAEGESGVVQ